MINKINGMLPFYQLTFKSKLVPRQCRSIQRSGTECIRLPLNTCGNAVEFFVPCKPGRKLSDPDLESGITECISCQKGWYNSLYGQTGCNAADLNYFVPEEGGTKQIPCPINSFTDERGSEKCIDLCGPGFKLGDSQTCVECSAGRYMPDTFHKNDRCLKQAGDQSKHKYHMHNI